MRWGGGGVRAWCTQVMSGAGGPTTYYCPSLPLHRHGGVQKFLSTLLRFKLIYHDKTTYDGTDTRKEEEERREARALFTPPSDRQNHFPFPPLPL